MHTLKPTCLIFWVLGLVCFVDVEGEMFVDVEI